MGDGPYDVAIVGGSFAGLAAALQLARASRRTILLDAGSPRNRFSSAAHGVPGWEGTPPGEILARFSDDLTPYPHVFDRDGYVTRISGSMDEFTLEIEGHNPVTARRVVLAHGVQDILLDIPGMTRHWGQRVLHCPYCHGYEVRGRPLGVLATNPMSAHQAQLLRADWSDDVTVLNAGLDGMDIEALSKAGVGADLRGLAEVRTKGDALALVLAGGETLDVAALFLSPTTSIAGTPADQLGCALGEGPMGAYVQTGPMKQSSVPGVFAAGDLASPMPNVNLAIADGTLAGGGCHQSLVFPDLIQPLEIAA